MKKLKDFTIKEFLQLQELLNEEKLDFFEIFKLYDLDLLKMDSTEFLNKKFEIENDVLPQPKGLVEKYYKIGGKKYKPTLNMRKITASQFIDLQTYLAKNDLAGIISIFMIPFKKKFLFKEIYYKYNDGYDMFELKNNINENMKIVDAQNLSAFFLSQSVKLQQVMVNYSTRKLMKLKLKQQKRMLTLPEAI
jgi:hypothetical protein